MSQLESLVQEIEELNSTEFERFGYIFTDALSGQHLHHRGLTPRGQPRGYTVDSYSEDGSIAGEYSIDKDYFSNLSKPKKDIQHVLKEFPQVKTIYLLAGTRLQPSEGKEMVKLCTDMEKIFQGKIIWYDAEKIAESIISNLLTRIVTINRLAKFLPSLINIYSTHPDTVSLPQLPANYRISPKTLEDSYCLLTSKRFLLLTGISGIGKSNLAVKLAQKLLENEHLDAVYFINSTEIQSYRELSAVSCEAGGRKINLPGTLQTRRSLVILDDLRHKLDEILESLQKLAPDSSYIIVTSQISSYYAEQIGAEFHVPYLNDENLVDKIVNWRLPQKQRCSKELIHLITEKTRGYPLLLNFIRSSLFYEELKTDEIETLLTDMATVEVDGEKELMFRLLSRHEQAIRKGLLCIQWLNCQYISEALLAKLATRTNIVSLYRRSLIQSSADVIKIHDIIYQCIIELPLQNVTERELAQCRNLFYQFFMEERRKKSAKYFKSLHLHEEKLSALAQQCQEPGPEWYFYIQSLSDHNHIFPAYMDERLKLWLNEPGRLEGTTNEYVIGTVLEYIDAQLRQIGFSNRERRAEYIELQAQRLANLLSKLDAPSSSSIRLDILHHLGKLLVSAHTEEKRNNALQCFLQVREENPNSYESLLQIAKIHKKGQLKSAVSELHDLLDIYLREEPISMSVVLAAYEELYTINDVEANKNYYFLDKFSSFKDAISSMAVESFDQPYKVLAKTMKFYTYQHPDQALFLMNSVPIPSTETIRRDSCFAVAQMYKEAGKALMWYTTPDLEQAKRYYNAAEEFYRTAPSAMLCRNYESIQRAENLILLEHFSEAEEYLRLHEFKSSPFWNYRMGQSLAHGGEESAKCSLYYLQTAVDLLTEKEKEKYLSAFLQERAKVLAQLRDPQAKCCFDESLKYCQNDKHKQQILRDIELYLP